MKDSFKILLKTVKSGNELSAMRALNSLREYDEKATTVIKNYTDKLKRKLEACQILLKKYQSKIDNDVPRIKMSIENKIIDYPSAVHALQVYDLDWFKSLIVSTDAIVQIATTLRDSSSKFNVSSPFWNSLADRDPQELNHIVTQESEG